MGSNRLSRKVCVVEILRAHRPRRPLGREEPPDHLVERDQVAKPRLDDTQEVLPVLRLEALRFRRVEGGEERVGLAAASGRLSSDGAAPRLLRSRRRARCSPRIAPCGRRPAREK